MIELSNGHIFEYMTASGALGFDGKGWLWEQPWRWLKLINPSLFTSVTKTLTFQPKKGNQRWYNPLRCIRLIDDGFVNAVALSNPGINWWCKKIGPTIDSTKIPLIASILGEPKELGKMAKMLNSFDLVGLEINTSCPNNETCALQDTKGIIEGCLEIKKNSKLPLILKINVNQNVSQILKGVKNLIEAISINSVPWRIAFPNLPSPLEKFGGGGISGKIAQPFTWSLIQELIRLTVIPIIGPSIWNFDDIKKVKNFGARAVSFGSVFIRYPWRPTLFVKKEIREAKT